MATVEKLVAKLLQARGRGTAVLARAADVNQAVAVARCLKERGKAHWFRGQVRNHPKLMPSFDRLDEPARQNALQRLDRFTHWVESTPGLETLAASSDAMIAVAQHHGLPTTFLDFTTDPGVAGFFASYSPDAVDLDTEGCIYCLDIQKADEIWNMVKSTLGSDSDVERLVLDVPNLWRLEAQKGVFVWSTYVDLNIPFPLDRIVFPYRGPVASPTPEQIYPKRESPLEALLREYFQAEQIAEGEAGLKTMLPTGWGRVITFDGLPYLGEHFVEAPAPHPSWNLTRIRPWREVRTELMAALAKARRLEFEIAPTETPDGAAARLQNLVNTRLKKEPALRRAPVNWRVTAAGRLAVTGGPSLADRIWAEEGLTGPVQRIWDEMVRLPWSNESIATALSAAIRWRLTAENLSAGRRMLKLEREKTTADALLHRPVKVEIGGLNNAHNWAWLAEAELLAAVRADFATLLRLESRDRILGNSFNTMMAARSPPLLFDFDRLTVLFASVMIPTQAVFNPKQPLFANPARARIIGPD
jgi:hypothetical protein